AKPRRNRARVDAERIGDLDGRELLELGQDEDFALLVVELFEKALNEARRFHFGECFVWPEMARIGKRLGIGVRKVDMRALAPSRSPILPNHAHENGKDPSLNRAASAWKVIEAKFGETPVSD